MMADTLKEIAYDELVSVILPYWMGRVVDLRHGGFFGRVDCYDRPCPDSDKAAILNARLVWAFSAAYRVLGDPILRSYADRACGYFREHFIDPQYGGVYFNLKCDGSVHEAGKHVYSNGFALYALSEYARATGDAGALEAALGVFHVLEERAWSAEDGGYLECFSRDWSTPLTRRRPGHMLSMNTHLHILEPYTNLYRVAPTSEVRAALGKLIGLFVNHIFDPATGHLIPWFEAGWKPVDRSFSYGHDIEASWLLKEAADVFDDPESSRLVDHVWQPLLRVALEGRRPDGGMVYERNPETGEQCEERVWWVQAEQVVGCVNGWQAGLGGKYLEMAAGSMDYIREHLSDRRNGEWFHRVGEDGSVNREDDKVSMWKCPYHNSRMCLELLERL